MYYHPLLYSRTATRDYRWLSYPASADRVDQAPLDGLFAAYFKYRGTARLARAAVAPLYLVRLSTITALITCGLTGLVDRFQRPIYALQGICVARADTRHLWFALPLLLTQSADWLNVARWSGSENASATNPQPAKARSLALSEIDGNISYLAALHQASAEPTNLSYPILLSFDVRGRENLLRCCASPSLPAGDILFGATPEMDSLFPRPIIKAPV
jgi:hypothetical protein